MTPKLSRTFVNVGRILLAAGAAALVAAFFHDRERGFFNSLWIFMFLLSLCLGSLFWIAIEHITGANWSTPIRRIPETVASFLPFLGMAGIPLMLGIHDLFHWSHEDVLQHDSLLAGKSAYLNVKFFVVRYVLCFGLWSLFAGVFIKNSNLQDHSGDQKFTAKNIKYAAAFLPAFAITLTIAAIDWMMSLEPHWYSTMFGVYYFAGTAGSSMAAITLLTLHLKKRGILHPHMRVDSLYSLGALMFAFTCFWAYIAFSQYMLIWYSNLPEETVWFLKHTNGSWRGMATGLIFIHFIVPFGLLLSRSAKMNPRRLQFTAWWILFAHAYDLYWVIFPTFHEAGILWGWQEAGSTLFGAGLFMTAFAWFARRKSFVPLKDPKLEMGLEFALFDARTQKGERVPLGTALKKAIAAKPHWAAYLTGYVLMIGLILLYFYYYQAKNIEHHTMENYLQALPQEEREFADLVKIKGVEGPVIDIMKMAEATPELVNKGKELFAVNCASCHGPEGRGDGVAGKMLQPPPRNFMNLEGWKNGPKFSGIYQTLQEGIKGSAMAPFDQLPIMDRIALIHFVRSLSQNPPKDSAAEIAALEAKYRISEGSKGKSQIPVATAIEKLVAEAAGKNAKAVEVLEKLQKEPSSPGAVLFAKVSLDQQKAVTALAQKPVWMGSSESLFKMLTFDPEMYGFKAGIGRLTAEEWKELHAFLVSHF